MCEDFGLQTQTAGLAVSYFDRFLSKVEQRGLDKDRVQLLSITCTLIAAKFSEIKMPGLDDLCEIAHNKYSKAELKEMELETLRMLQWELHAVTPHAALEQLAIAIALRQVSPNPNPDPNPNPKPNPNPYPSPLTQARALNPKPKPQPNPNPNQHAGKQLEHAEFFVDLSCYVVSYPPPHPTPSPPHSMAPAPQPS